MSLRFPRRLAAVLIAGAACAAVAGAAAPKSAHWKSKLQMEGGPQGSVSSDMEIWTKDQKMRTKMSIMGMNMYMVHAGDFLYQWPDGQKSGMKFSTSAGQRNQGAEYVNKIDEYRTKGKKVGTETIEGHVCDIYELTSPAQDAKEKEKKETVWIAKGLDFPVKYIVESGSSKMTAVNTDITLGGKVDETLFAVPSDIQFQDMTEAMKAMQQKSKQPN